MISIQRLALAGLVLSLACALPISVRVAPDASDLGLRSVALAPLEAGSGITTSESADAVAVRVTGLLLEQLTLAGFQVIPPDEVLRVLTEGGSSLRPLGAAEMARALSSQFRIDALVSGRVLRYRRRSGGPRGSQRPASVWLSVKVHDLEGRILWQGDYDETQASVANRLSRFRLALSRNFEWLTADQLARFGAREIARRMRRDVGAWN